MRPVVWDGCEVSPCEQAYREQLDWLVSMAMTPGWWQHSRLRARELEADESGLFAGIVEAVRERLKAAGFKPAQNELKEIEP